MTRQIPVIAVCNQKGGVGKTTTTYHLARAGSVAGLRVLVIDMDPQGNLTAALAPDLGEDVECVAHALSAREKTRLGGVIVDSVWDGVKLAPTTTDVLALVRDELVVAGAGRERRLADQLSECIDGFDVVLIDCPPSLDQLTVNALTAAIGVVVVTAARLWSASGLVRLSETVGQVKAAYNPRLAHLGIVVNAMEPGTRTGRYWHEELRVAAETAGMRLFAPAIPKRTLIGDTAESSLGLDEQGVVGRELAEIYSGYLEELLAACEKGGE